MPKLIAGAPQLRAMIYSRPSLVAQALALCLSGVLCACGPTSDEADTAGSLGQTVESGISVEAQALLAAMAEKLTGAERIEFRVKRVVDPVFLLNESADSNTEARLNIKRPNKLYAEITGASGTKGMFFDGEVFVIFNKEIMRFAKTDLSGTLDDLAIKTGEMLEISIPFMDFIGSDPLKELSRYALSGSVIGEETINGILCSHIRVQEDVLFWDLWLDKDTDLPRRYLITATELDGQPTSLADSIEVILNASQDDSMFDFDPPNGAIEIPMRSPEYDE